MPHHTVCRKPTSNPNKCPYPQLIYVHTRQVYHTSVIGFAVQKWPGLTPHLLNLNIQMAHIISFFLLQNTHMHTCTHTHKYIHILRRLHPQSNGKWKLLDYSVFLCLLKSQMSYKLIFCTPGYHAYVPLTGCHLNGDKLARESSNEMLHTGKISESMDQL